MYALTSGQLYCAAAAVIFGDSGYLNSSHSAVLQALSRHGIHCSDQEEKTITETILRLESPIKIVSLTAWWYGSSRQISLFFFSLLIWP